MKNLRDPNKVFSQYDPGDFIVPPLVVAPRPADDRGFMYLLRNSQYPKWIKIGRSRDLVKRLQAYNADIPVPTAYYVAVSQLFPDAVLAEKKILETITRKDLISPSTNKFEWFDAEHEEYLMDLITKAESEFI